MCAQAAAEVEITAAILVKSTCSGWTNFFQEDLGRSRQRSVSPLPNSASRFVLEDAASQSAFRRQP